MVHSYMQSIKSLSAFRIKSSIRYDDELQYISQMSAINVYDYVKHFHLKKILCTIIKYIISLLFCVLLFSMFVG